MTTTIFPFDSKAKAKANHALEKHQREHLSRELTQSAQQGDWDQVEVLVHEAREKGFLTTEEITQLDEIVGNQEYMQSLREKISPTVPVQMKTKDGNVFAGKGKSYVNRVEGPDGWGQYVEPIDDDTDIPF